MTIGWIDPHDEGFQMETDKGVEVFHGGEILSREDYPALFAVIGYVYGRENGNFHVPDFRAKILGV